MTAKILTNSTANSFFRKEGWVHTYDFLKCKREINKPELTFFWLVVRSVVEDYEMAVSMWVGYVKDDPQSLLVIENNTYLNIQMSGFYLRTRSVYSIYNRLPLAFKDAGKAFDYVKPQLFNGNVK